MQKFLKKEQKRSEGNQSPPDSLNGSAKTETCSIQPAAPGTEAMSPAAIAAVKAVEARKELVKKRQEKALEQIQKMQQKFLERNLEHMQDLEEGNDDQP